VRNAGLLLGLLLGVLVAAAPAAAQAPTAEECLACHQDPGLQRSAPRPGRPASVAVDPKALDALVDTYENKLGPHIGARIVARAWVDPAYKQRLLADTDAAIEELGFGGQQGERMVAVENTRQAHNVIVCTLCSCYPWSVLGLPPMWYKSAAYRSRTVIDPRGVLRELGLELPENVEVHVWDSTADLRYLVLPERPAGTENFSEQELARLVTRDSMIGVAKVKWPPEGGQA